MDKNTFIANYITSFLGAWAAKQYGYNNDTDSNLYLNQPVNEAYELALKAWDDYKKLIKIPAYNVAAHS